MLFSLNNYSLYEGLEATGLNSKLWKSDLSLETKSDPVLSFNFILVSSDQNSQEFVYLTFAFWFALPYSSSGPTPLPPPRRGFISKFHW